MIAQMSLYIYLLLTIHKLHFMPVSVDQLFKALKLKYEGPFKWNEKLKANYNGVYIITLTEDPKDKSKNKFQFALCPDTFKRWLIEANDLEIQGKKVNKIKDVKKYLEQFWNPNENILYIGESSSQTNPLEKRINQFYVHKVEQKGPHTGGFWLKLLPCLKDTFIYYAKVERPRETEFKLIMKFVELSTTKEFYDLDNFSKYFPFANLKVDIMKDHEIRNHTNKNFR